MLSTPSMDFGNNFISYQIVGSYQDNKQLEKRKNIFKHKLVLKFEAVT